MKLEIKNLTISYGNQVVLDDISLKLDDINSLVIIGPSGGGKTTLLRIIAGLETPDSGEILIDGIPIPKTELELREYRKQIGMVFQSYNLFPHLTMLENITLPLEKVHGFSVKDACDRAWELLERFQLSEHSFKKPGQLSGGQKQRTALARAIAVKSKFLLLDEPTSALDPELTSEVLDMIQELRDEGKELILVTHEMGFAHHVSDYTLFMGNAKIIEAGKTKEIFENPKDKAMKQFMKKILKY